jgi:xanthine dehydrogenase YagR molybdenum-binding subunit
MRAPGWPQGCFALELAMDEMARKLNLDRLEFRRRNNANPIRAQEFALGAKAFNWDEKSRAPKSRGPLRRGIGVAAAAWHAIGSAGPQAQAIAFRDGRVAVRIGTQDIGTGTRTVLAMVAAEELGLPLNKVDAEIGDTRYLYSVPSGGSGTAPSNTPAVRQAAAHLREKLFRIAAPMLGAEPGDLEARDGMIRVRFEPSRGFRLIRCPRKVSTCRTTRDIGMTRLGAISLRSRSTSKLGQLRCSTSPPCTTRAGSSILSLRAARSTAAS